jgi:hypothetical protein
LVQLTAEGDEALSMRLTMQEACQRHTIIQLFDFSRMLFKPGGARPLSADIRAGQSGYGVRQLAETGNIALEPAKGAAQKLPPVALDVRPRLYR